MSFEAVTSPEINSSQKHILVVEDNVALRFTFSEWLRQSNYIVYEAASADEAVTLLASPITIDIVVTDVEMPGTLNGLGLVDHIRNVIPQLPVIVVSAHDMQLERQNKFTAFFRKPYDLDKVTFQITSMLVEA